MRHEIFRTLVHGGSGGSWRFSAGGGVGDAGKDAIELSEDFDESDDADEAVKAAEEAFADDDDDTDADIDTDDFDEEYSKAFSKSDDSDAK